MPSLRRATVNDLETVFQLRIEFLSDVWGSDGFSNTALVNSTRAYIERQLPSNQLRVWFAEEHGEIVATGAMIFFDRMPTMDNPLGLEAYLLSVYTRKEHRGRGIAPMIMKAMIAHAREAGAGRVFLHASDAGRPVYEKLGFTATTFEMDLYFTK